MKAVKKPVEIDFFTFEEVSKMLHEGKEISGDRKIKYINPTCYEVSTLEGNYIFTPDDVLIKGVKGEIYPCKKDIFDMTYSINEHKSVTRLTKQHLQSLIIGDPTFLFHDDKVTVCLLHVQPDFYIVGKSAVLDRNQFNMAIGRTVAYDDAFRQLWELVAYHMCHFKA